MSYRKIEPRTGMLRFVLVEARRPSVGGCAVPGVSEQRSKGASFISAEIGCGNSRPARLGGKDKTCPLSSGSGELRIGWSATGKYAIAVVASPSSILPICI